MGYLWWARKKHRYNVTLLSVQACIWRLQGSTGPIQLIQTISVIIRFSSDTWGYGKQFFWWVSLEVIISRSHWGYGRCCFAVAKDFGSPKSIYCIGGSKHTANDCFNETGRQELCKIPNGTKNLVGGRTFGGFICARMMAHITLLSV